MKKRRGRPKKMEVRKPVAVMLLEAEREELAAAVSQAGELSLSTWARKALLAAARREAQNK